MPVLTIPTRKRRITMGLKDDSITPPEATRKALAPGARVLAQTGKTPDLIRDAARFAKLPGKRISASGNIYWESRRSRSDAPGSNL